MRRAAYPLALSSLLLTALLNGCVGCGPAPGDDAGVTDGGVTTDGGDPSGDGGGDPDGGDPNGDGGPGPGPGGPVVTACEGAPEVDPGAETCVVQSGTSGTLIVGDVLVPGSVYEQGAVLLDDDGVIQCVGCDCFDQAADATKVICPDAVISPGLINAHDHIGWMSSSPWVAADNNVDPELRWEHRHDWRTGKRGHPEISTSGGSNNDQKAWGELRFILGGATSVFGSGSAPGLMRNLDGFNGTVPEIDQPVALYETFPLGDSNGSQRASGCDYPGVDGPQDVDAYVPHVSEGIDAEARNEFLCLTGQGDGAQDTIQANTAIVHGVGLHAQDIALLGSRGGKLVWSPRSNVSLYGDTAAVTLYDRMGISIGLGTDWMPSGSMSMLRELKCADELNERNFGGYFSDEDLWLMATLGAARALAMEDAIGVLTPGRTGDIAVFRNSGRRHHRAILDATAGDVALVLRGGEVLSGDAAVVDALEQGCDLLEDVCGRDKRACLAREINKSLADLESDVGDIYPLFFCDVPEDEPSCLPARTLEGDVVNGSNLYDGMSIDGDRDGDGVLDTEDSCPDIFNPRRPLDGSTQADADGDQVGDVCDPCPLDADTDECEAFDPDDPDGDGVPTTEDNCPDVSNDQVDGDSDGKGDACDACPDYTNPGDAGCLVPVYDVKTDPALVGQRVAMQDLVVTGILSNGFFAQLDPGAGSYDGSDDSGVFFYTGAAPTVSLWEVLDVSGATVSLFFNQVQMMDATFTATRNSEPLAPRTLTAAEVTQAVTDGAASGLEGLLVEVVDVTVTNPTPEPGPGDSAENEFEITGGFRVDDAIYLIDPQPVQDESFARIAGPLAWRNDHLKILPRDANDIAAGEAEVTAFGPAPAFVRVGATGAIGQDLVVEVARNVAADLVVEITSDDAGVATVAGGTVTIPAGSRSAVVPVQGVAAGSTTLRASRQGSDVEVTADVQVIAADAAPTLVSLTPETASVATGATQTFEVGLDIPAPAGGVTVTLAVTGDVGTVPASVTIDADARTASFDLTADMSTATGTVTATLGDTTLEADVDVVAFVGALVINEVDYDNASTDSAEFVEIYNGTSSAVDLTGYAVLLVNGNNNTVYKTVDLSGAGSLPAGGFLVVHTPAVTPDESAISVEMTLDNGGSIQNGDPDGVALVSATEVIDALSYEGAMPMANLGAPYGTAVDLGDGSSLTDPGDGAIARSTDGRDTDVHADDWVFTATATPGAPNQVP